MISEVLVESFLASQSLNHYLAHDSHTEQPARIQYGIQYKRYLCIQIGIHLSPHALLICMEDALPAPSTVRVSEETRAILRDLSRQLNEPMQAVLTKAVEAYRRQCILEETNVAYATLRADPQAWSEEQEERAAWDATLADRLERE